jgi:hypothetical protein
MQVDAAYQSEAARAIDQCIAKLRALTYQQAAALPEAWGEEAQFGGIRCAITVFRQPGPLESPNTVLVTVQVARRGFLGISSSHTERGLIFMPEGGIREASELELQHSGG